MRDLTRQVWRLRERAAAAESEVRPCQQRIVLVLGSTLEKCGQPVGSVPTWCSGGRIPGFTTKVLSEASR